LFKTFLNKAHLGLGNGLPLVATSPADQQGALLALAIPTLLVVSVVVFVLQKLLPGDAVTLMTAEADLSVSDLARIRAELGLDRAWPVQYLVWMWGVVQGDLGTSLSTFPKRCEGRRKQLTLPMAHRTAQPLPSDANLPRSCFPCCERLGSVSTRPSKGRSSAVTLQPPSLVA
jgi:hypothetical protein